MEVESEAEDEASTGERVGSVGDDPDAGTDMAERAPNRATGSSATESSLFRPSDLPPGTGANVKPGLAAGGGRVPNAGNDEDKAANECVNVVGLIRFTEGLDQNALSLAVVGVMGVGAKMGAEEVVIGEGRAPAAAAAGLLDDESTAALGLPEFVLMACNKELSAAGSAPNMAAWAPRPMVTPAAGVAVNGCVPVLGMGDEVRAKPMAGESTRWPPTAR
jgi:hypothetical protein